MRGEVGGMQQQARKKSQYFEVSPPNLEMLPMCLHSYDSLLAKLSKVRILMGGLQVVKPVGANYAIFTSDTFFFYFIVYIL